MKNKLANILSSKLMAFTLIEILISIIIITIFLNYSFTFFFNTLEDSKLTTFSEKLITLFELAKKKSMLGDQENNLCANLGTKIGAYGIKYLVDNVNLCLYCQDDYNFCHLLRKEKLEKNIEIIINNSDQILFYPIEGKTKIEESWTIKNKNNNHCLDISVNEIGVININEIRNCD